MTSIVSDAAMHVVLGASGNAGSALVRELTSRGANVRAVSRHAPDDRPAGVEWVEADAASESERDRVYAGASVVYLAAHPLYTRWLADFPPLVEGAIAGAASAGAVLVHVDNAYMYGPSDGELTEATPIRSTGKKGKLRGELANRILDAHARGTVRATIGRGADFFGPGVGGSVAGDSLFFDILSGRRAMWLGGLDVPHSLTYVDDLARALIALGSEPRAWGEVWHIPGAPALTGRDFLSLAFEAASLSPKIGVHSRLSISFAALFSTLVGEVKETLYQFERPFVLNADKYQRAFGPFAVTAMREALQQTVTYYRGTDAAE